MVSGNVTDLAPLVTSIFPTVFLLLFVLIPVSTVYGFFKRSFADKDDGKKKKNTGGQKPEAKLTLFGITIKRKGG